MPIYEFECLQCGHVFEELVMSGDDQEITCPKCRGHRVGKLISRTGTVKKGGAGGFAATAAPACGPSGFS